MPVFIFCVERTQQWTDLDNSMHQIYPEADTENIRKPSVILTEDSNAGYTEGRFDGKQRTTNRDIRRYKTLV